MPLVKWEGDGVPAWEEGQDVVGDGGEEEDVGIDVDEEEIPLAELGLLVEDGEADVGDH